MALGRPAAGRIMTEVSGTEINSRHWGPSSLWASVRSVVPPLLALHGYKVADFSFNEKTYLQCSTQCPKMYVGKKLFFPIFPIQYSYSSMFSRLAQKLGLTVRGSESGNADALVPIIEAGELFGQIFFQLADFLIDV